MCRRSPSATTITTLQKPSQRCTAMTMATSEILLLPPPPLPLPRPPTTFVQADPLTSTTLAPTSPTTFQTPRLARPRISHPKPMDRPSKGIGGASHLSTATILPTHLPYYHVPTPQKPRTSTSLSMILTTSPARPQWPRNLVISKPYEGCP